MRKNYNQDGVFVDVGLLRDHISKLRAEKKLAARLYEELLDMLKCVDPTEYSQCKLAARDADQLVEYFDRMIRVLSNAEADAIHMSREIGARIEDETEHTHYISSRSFML